MAATRIRAGSAGGLTTTMRRTLNAESGKTIVVVLHDLNLACRFCDHVIAMVDGRIVAEGRPIDAVTAGLVEKVFGLVCVIVPDPVAGTPMVVPAWPARNQPASLCSLSVPDT